MKKQLTILAGSMLAAASSQAIVLGTDTIAIFNTAGQGSFIQQITGSTGDSLAAGTGFSVDVSAATAALGGSIDSFALVALTTPSGASVFNYDEGFYIDSGAGAVFASNTGGGDENNNNTRNIINAISGFLDLAVFGANAEGTNGDADGSAAILTSFGGLLQSGTSGLFQRSESESGFNNVSAVTITSPEAAIEGLNLEGNTFSATALATNEIPVPAAAWLFGSALLGLGVVRRKK